MIIEEAEKILGYHFRDPKLLGEALTHASSTGHRLESNERLEFLGDAILGFVISMHLFQTFPTYEEGELTKLKSAVVSRKVCAKVSQKLNLGAMLNLGKGMSDRPSLPNSVAAAVLEAVIGAIYLDGGMEPVQKFILDHMLPYVHQLNQSTHQHNFKSVLQQYAQKNYPANPGYVLLDERGPDHSKCFEICVEINGRRFAPAWDNSKKEAEQKAALLALKELGLVVEDEFGEIHIRQELEKPSRPLRPNGSAPENLPADAADRK